MNWFNKFLVFIGVKEVVEVEIPEIEIRGTEDVEKKSDVLVVITERENQEFIEINSENAALIELQNNIIDRLTASNKKQAKLWKRLRNKYGLPTPLQLNNETREIRNYNGRN